MLKIERSFTTGLISEGNIVSLHALATFTTDAATQEVGATLNNFNLNWTYNRNANDPESQTINNGIGLVAVNLRTYAVTGAALTTSTTYTIDAVGDDVTWGATVGNPSSLSLTISFLPRRYFGVSSSLITTGAGIITAFGATGEFATSRVVSKTFDASVSGGANYIYYSYPTSFGAPVTVTFNGFLFTDYTLSTVSLTNASGFTQNYYIMRTNNVFSGAMIVYAITS